MALSNLAEFPKPAAMDCHPIFDRLPTKIFGPLASQNKHLYWALLCKMHVDRFGPDAPLPPSQGYTTREIIQDVERFLLEQDTWATEDSETPETPLNIRACGVFNRLLDAGWLHSDWHGIEKTVSMRPVVAHFLNQLISFAESGPVFVSGKINSIDANLKLVVERAASGDTLSEVAQQARNLLEHVRNTSMIIRDLMEQLSRESTPASYVSRFFSDYIEQVFIGDYRSLRTHEHPLAKRQRILQMVDRLDESDLDRDRLISWYQTNRFAGDRGRGTVQYEKDIFRLRELARIDEYLDRLDDEIRRANKKAITYLDYNLRALRPVDDLVRSAISCLLQGASSSFNDPFPAGDMVCSASLSDPRRASERAVPSFLRKHTPSPEELARSRLMLRARDARTVTPPKLAEFVMTRLAGESEVGNSNMKLETVADIRAYQSLLSIAHSMSTGSVRLRLGTRTLARGFHVKNTGDIEEPHILISSKAFTVSLTSTPKGKSNE